MTNPSPASDTRHPADKVHQSALLGRNLRDLIARHPGGSMDAVVIALMTIGFTIRDASAPEDIDETASKLERTFSNALRNDPPSVSSH